MRAEQRQIWVGEVLVLVAALVDRFGHGLRRSLVFPRVSSEAFFATPVDVSLRLP
jgi:hypothetical protein